jgi:hypothetical protein
MTDFKSIENSGKVEAAAKLRIRIAKKVRQRKGHNSYDPM